MGVGAVVIVKVTVMDWGELVAPPDVIAIFPVWVPTERPLILTPAANDPLFVPEAADEPFKVSHGTFDVAVQFRVPVPLLLIVTD